MDNIPPILGGHRRGALLESEILGLVSAGAKAPCSWWSVLQHCCALGIE